MYLTKKNVIFTIKLNSIEFSNSLFLLNVSMLVCLLIFFFYYFHDGIFAIQYHVSWIYSYVVCIGAVKNRKSFYRFDCSFISFKSTVCTSIFTFCCCCCCSISIGIYLSVCKNWRYFESIASRCSFHLPKIYEPKGWISIENSLYMYSALMIPKGSIVISSLLLRFFSTVSVCVCRFNIN